MRTMTHLIEKTRSFVATLTKANDYLSPELQYKANLLRIIVYANLFAVAVLVFYTIFGMVSNKLAGTLVTIPTIALNLWALHRIRQGLIKGVGELIIGISWVSIALAAYGTGGLYSSAMLGMIVLLVMANACP